MHTTEILIWKGTNFLTLTSTLKINISIVYLYHARIITNRVTLTLTRIQYITP